jgi:hypothetical protein
MCRAKIEIYVTVADASQERHTNFNMPKNATAPVNTAELRGNVTEKCFNPKINKVCQPQCCITDINLLRN